MKALAYARLSLDRNGEGIAVARQLEDCRAIALSRGWTLVGEHVDNSLSAWKAGVRRPGWEAMLQAVGEGAADALIVWHGDRLIRQPRDLERLIDLADGGLKIASVAGERDLSSPDDRFILRIEVAAQCRESDATSRRVKRALEARAMAGTRAGNEPFGWRSHSEAAVVRQICSGVLAGRSIRFLTKELNEAGVPAPNGGTWDKSSVRYIARRPANAGLRTHKGEVVGTGDWDALISVEQHEAILRVTAPRRQGVSGHTRVHLLSGLLRCGKCGAAMTHVVVNGRAVYRCSASSHLSVGADDAEEFVTLLTQARLEMRDALREEGGSVGRRAELAVQIASARAAAEAIAEDFASGAVSRDVMRAGSAAASRRKKAAEDELADLDRREGALAAGSSADFVNAPLDSQRAVIAALMTLEARPAKTRSRHSRIEDRIVVRWVES